jgi:hypothetical protein
VGPFGDGLVKDGLEVGLRSGVGEAVADGLAGADGEPGARGQMGILIIHR